MDVIWSAASLVGGRVVSEASGMQSVERTTGNSPAIQRLCQNLGSQRQGREM